MLELDTTINIKFIDDFIKKFKDESGQNLEIINEISNKINYYDFDGDGNLTDIEQYNGIKYIADRGLSVIIKSIIDIPIKIQNDV